MPPRVLAVLPVYNEQHALGELLPRFESLERTMPGRLRLVAVDDGSTDASAEVLRSFQSRLPIDIVTHERNQGLGATLRDGLRFALAGASTSDVIVALDADNTQPPDLIPSMLDRIANGFDVVIASRYQPGARVVGLSVFRHLLSFGARIVFRIVTPVDGVRDYTCGFRAYRAGALQKAFDSSHASLEGGFAASVELLLLLRSTGARMCEVPLVLRYDHKPTPSKMKVLSNVVRHLVLVLKHRSAPKPPESAQRAAKQAGRA